MRTNGTPDDGQGFAGEPPPDRSSRDLESRRAAASPGPTAGGSGGSPTRDRLSTLAEQIRLTPGVLAVVLQAADDAPGTARSQLEVEATGLARLGRRLGESLRIGRVVVGVMQGSERNVLLLTTRDRQLTVLIRADDQAEAVQARIRKLISGQG